MKNIFLSAFLCIQLLAVTNSYSQGGIITTIAGNGSKEYSGDGGQAVDAGLSSPGGLFIDVDGNLYIADSSNHCIRKVDPSGIISTIAGNGTSGYSGDGSKAQDAQLNSPNDIYISALGELFIADTGNECIRKIDNSGIITTVAGNGVEGFERGEFPATETSLNAPFGVYVNDNGNIFIADTANHKIRKVEDGILSTIAGRISSILDPFGYGGDGGQAVNALFWNPTEIYGDQEGNLYIADYVNNFIRKIDASGIITSIVGTGSNDFTGDGGSAVNASIAQPSDVFVDSFGNIFICDTGNQRIRKVDASGIISTVAGNGGNDSFADNVPATETSLIYPSGICVDTIGNLYIADTDNNRIRKVVLETNVKNWKQY